MSVTIYVCMAYVAVARMPCGHHAVQDSVAYFVHNRDELPVTFTLFRSFPFCRLIFHCPGDIVFSVYRQPVLRPFFDVMRGIATAHSMCASP